MSAVAAAEKEKTPPARLRRACHGFAALRCPAVRHPRVSAGGAYVVTDGVGAAYAPFACQDAALAYKTSEYFFGRTYAFASMLHRPKKCHAVLRATGACSAIPPSPSTWRTLGVRLIILSDIKGKTGTHLSAFIS